MVGRGCTEHTNVDSEGGCLGYGLLLDAGHVVFGYLRHYAFGLVPDWVFLRLEIQKPVTDCCEECGVICDPLGDFEPA